MHCVSCVAISLIGFVLDKCSFIVQFVDGLFIYGCNFLRFDIFRMSTRRLYVIFFVFSFRVTVISSSLWRGVLWWPRSFCFLPPVGVNIYIYTTFHRLFIIVLLSPPP